MFVMGKDRETMERMAARLAELMEAMPVELKEGLLDRFDMDGFEASLKADPDKEVYARHVAFMKDPTLRLYTIAMRDEDSGVNAHMVSTVPVTYREAFQQMLLATLILEKMGEEFELISMPFPTEWSDENTTDYVVNEQHGNVIHGPEV